MYLLGNKVQICPFKGSSPGTRCFNFKHLFFCVYSFIEKYLVLLLFFNKLDLVLIVDLSLNFFWLPSSRYHFYFCQAANGLHSDQPSPVWLCF